MKELKNYKVIGSKKPDKAAEVIIISNLLALIKEMHRVMSEELDVELNDNLGTVVPILTDALKYLSDHAEFETV